MSSHIPEKTSPHAAAPYLVIGGGLLAVSTASLFIRYAQQEAPSLVIAASRLAIATLILAPIAWKRSKSEIKALKGTQIRALAISGLFLALHFATWILSLEYTTVVQSVILVSTTPLWVAMISPAFLKERVTPIVIIGLLVALAGSVMVGLSEVCQVGPSGVTCSPIGDFLKGRAFIGNILALAGAWGAAGYVLIGRQARQNLSLLSYVFLVYGVAAACLLIGVAAAGYPLAGYSTRTYVWFVALALIPQILGHSSFNWALRYLPATFVSVSLLGEPIGTSILAMIFLGESLSTLVLIGGVMICLGVYLVSKTQSA